MSELEISEIFYSIQGETSLVGKPAVFIRLSNCNLNCRWCDTEYARGIGKKVRISRILSEIAKFRCPLVIITGGEPLLQTGIKNLMEELAVKNYQIVVETNGSEDISIIPPHVKIILDIKTPSSGETDRMDFTNIARLKETDELKFVIADRHDFDWSRNILNEYSTRTKEILFSPVKSRISLEELAEWVKTEIPTVRVQPNIHKVFALR